MIEKLLTRECIEIEVDVNDWSEAIKEAGKLLVKVNKATNTYIDGMIESMNEIGPYIVMVPGVAMPHARPEKGAKEIGVSIIKLKTPVNFGHEEYDPVSLVFALCAPASKNHLELLQDLSYVLEDINLVDKAEECMTKDELLKLIMEIYNENKTN